MTNGDSVPFLRLRAAQHEINQFLWSSEFAYELIRQKIVAPVRSDGRDIHEVFHDIKCHAFIPGTKAQEAIQMGIKPQHPVKYRAEISDFESHLRQNLEPVCRYVIVQFHSALEGFLWERTQSFLISAAINKTQRKAIQKHFQRTDYRELEQLLSRHVTLRSSIPPKTASLAQTFRMVRNDVVHKDKHWRPPGQMRKYEK